MNKNQAKDRLDEIIKKSRVDLYKPIQVAETLYRSRIVSNINYDDLDTYRTQSRHWRDNVTNRLLGKVSTSSARYQDDIWNQNAFPKEIMKILDEENRKLNGLVERYIYLRFQERQKTVCSVINYILQHNKSNFCLLSLINLFIHSAGIRRSIDKAYEIITHSLLETVVTGLGVTVTVTVPPVNSEMLIEFEDLAKVIVGLSKDNLTNTFEAHIYRVGVTNAADRGLDMWANFGPAVQVKHLTIDPKIASTIVDQVESDHVIVVCKSSEKSVIEIVAQQISWGQRVRGIITEYDLNNWYKKCLKGKYSQQLGDTLLMSLKDGFLSEFPQTTELINFIQERNYNIMNPDSFWEL